jgi:flavin reductase (DIM6/NTAB) family NADH-FMN oxidoreductase RutF
MSDVRLFDSRDLRRVLGTFVTGVTVVTTTDDEGRFHGVTANSFSSVSLDPPLVLWSQAVKSHSHPVFFKAERFAVNILAENQIELSNRFAKSSQEKFAGIGSFPGCRAATIRSTLARCRRSIEPNASRWFSGTVNICWLVPTI